MPCVSYTGVISYAACDCRLQFAPSGMYLTLDFYKNNY